MPLHKPEAIKSVNVAHEMQSQFKTNDFIQKQVEVKYSSVLPTSKSGVNGSKERNVIFFPSMDKI